MNVAALDENDLSKYISAEMVELLKSSGAMDRARKDGLVAHAATCNSVSVSVGVGVSVSVSVATSE